MPMAWSETLTTHGTHRPSPRLYTPPPPGSFPPVDISVETFEPEIRASLANYDRHIVCLEKGPEDCEAALRSLIEKAIKAYLTRGPGLRHGIALDRHVTVILSQNDEPRPLCGIYFNLHSPYARKPAPRSQTLSESPSEK